MDSAQLCPFRRGYDRAGQHHFVVRGLGGHDRLRCGHPRVSPIIRHLLCGLRIRNGRIITGQVVFGQGFARHARSVGLTQPRQQGIDGKTIPGDVMEPGQPHQPAIRQGRQPVLRQRVAPQRRIRHLGDALRRPLLHITRNRATVLHRDAVRPRRCLVRTCIMRLKHRQRFQTIGNDLRQYLHIHRGVEGE